MKHKVPKRTLTYADTLEAVGVASLLEELTNAGVRLIDQGDSYLIGGKELPGPDRWSMVDPGYPFIYLKSDGKVPSGWVLDYEREKEKADQLKKATGKKRDKIAAALREQGMSELPAPIREYRMAVFLASMRKGWSADKQLYRWLKEDSQRTRSWIAHNLGLDQGIGDEAPEISNSQVFNPISGKGIHRPKPDSTSAGSISSEVINPFAEWMKFRGAYRVMLPYYNDGDWKVYVIEPADIRVAELTMLRNELSDLNLWGGVRLDIEAVLRLTELLIQHSDVMGNSIPLRRRRPAEVIRGLHQAYFQSLGTAAALMNYSFAGLPSWFTIHDPDDAEALISVIREHIGDKQRDGTVGCLRSLNPDHSGDIPVLQQYRKWLMTSDLRDFLAFCQLFALHVMDRMGKDEWVRTMSTNNLDVILGRGYQMQDITEREGFKSVAHAVRNATVYALSFQKQKRGEREVHFGLAQKWKQKIKGGNEEFIAALCDFVQQYNWESEKLETASGKQGGGESGVVKSRHKVKVDELNEVIQLINDRGAELVGMLLLAYGYARAPKSDTGQQMAEQNKE